MVIFNELRITSDGKNMIVDVSVDPAAYYPNVYLDNIVIDDQNTYINNGPSTTPVYKYQFPTGVNEKNIRIFIDSSTISSSFDTSMFFVYVTTKGIPSILTPCGEDENTKMNTVINMYPYYRKSIGYLKEVQKDCDVPVNFINHFLRFQALDYAIKTGHYIEAIKIWKKFFMKFPKTVLFSNCGCNGN